MCKHKATPIVIMLVALVIIALLGGCSAGRSPYLQPVYVETAGRTEYVARSLRHYATLSRADLAVRRAVEEVDGPGLQVEVSVQAAEVWDDTAGPVDGVMVQATARRVVGATRTLIGYEHGQEGGLPAVSGTFMPEPFPDMAGGWNAP